MEIVHQHAPLSMGWCLDCHRNPDERLRPVTEMTNMSFNAATDLTEAERVALKDQYHINPNSNCSTCHR
jgi:ArsR family metal-binding transcriptional regulator